MLDIYEPPISTAWFQKQLDAIHAAFPGSVKLRVEWAPRLIEAKVIDRAGNQRIYRKYPLLGMETHEYHVGNYFRRRGKIVAYQKVGELIPPNVRVTDIAVPHIERINHSVHLFVIEKKLPDEYARKMWADKRTISRSKLGMDIFGPFPSEGVWTWFDDISEHRLINESETCCDVAERASVRCQGLYREPNGADLDRVRQAFQAHEQRSAMRDEQEVRDHTAAIVDWEANQRLEILKEARECERIDKLAHEKTRVIGGTSKPLHTTPY